MADDDHHDDSFSDANGFLQFLMIQNVNNKEEKARWL